MALLEAFIKNITMKYLASLITTFMLMLPLAASAQLTVPQGGTGQTSFTANQILYGNSSLRLGSEAAFTYNPSTNLLTVTNASTTALSVGSVSNTEIGYLNGVTSAIQTQLDAKQATLGNDDITPDMVLSTGQTDEYVLTYEATGDTWEWAAAAAASFTDIDTDYGAETVTSVWTLSGNWVNTANPWADNEVSDTLTIGSGSTIAAGLILEPDLNTDVVAADGDYLQYDSTGTNFTWRDASEVRTDLGLVIGTNVQAYDADLTTYAGITPSANVQTFLGAADYSAMRTQLSLGSLALLSAVGTSEITNDTITEADVNNSYTLAGDPALAASECWFATTGIICEGSTANGFESLLTFTDPTADRTITFQNITGTVYVSGGTDVTVADGGTGASSLTAGGVLYGNGTSAITNSGVLTNGQLLIGDGSGAPTVATLTQGTGMTVTNGAGSITLATTLGTSIADAEIDADTITYASIADADQASTMCIYIEDPADTDDLKSIWANKTANDFLLTELWAESDQTVNFDLQVDDGTPADVNGTDISPAAGEAEDTSLSGDTTVAAGEELDLAITSVSGTPTWVSICWTGNWVD